MTIPLANQVVDVESPRPTDVGVIAMEVYFPRRVRVFPRHPTLVLTRHTVCLGGGARDL